MATVFVRPRARQDLLREANYLAEEGSETTAENFLEAVQTTLTALASMPRKGALCGFPRSTLRTVRRWPVSGFENWLIFYRTRRDGIEVLHLIHGARELKSLLGWQ